jgi:hypothetical protein
MSEVKKLGFPAKVVAVVLLAQLIILRMISWADSEQVWLLGRQLHWGCWFKQQFGIPCPTCGMTRSVILTLHGHLDQAFSLNAGGPILITGLILISLTLFYRASVPHDQRSGRRLAVCAIMYGWLYAAVIMGQWTMKLRGS